MCIRGVMHETVCGCSVCIAASWLALWSIALQSFADIGIGGCWHLWQADVAMRFSPWGSWGTVTINRSNRSFFFSVERFTGKETGRDRPAGVQGPTSTGKIW